MLSTDFLDGRRMEPGLSGETMTFCFVSFKVPLLLDLRRSLTSVALTFLSDLKLDPIVSAGCDFSLPEGGFPFGRLCFEATPPSAMSLGGCGLGVLGEVESDSVDQGESGLLLFTFSIFLETGFLFSMLDLAPVRGTLCEDGRPFVLGLTSSADARLLLLSVGVAVGVAGLDLIIFCAPIDLRFIDPLSRVLVLCRGLRLERLDWRVSVPVCKDALRGEVVRCSVCDFASC